MMNLGDEAVIVGYIQKFIIWQKRRLARSNISQDNAAQFMTWERRLAIIVTVLAAIRFARLFENLTIHVVKPAVIDAAQAAVFQSAIAQIHAAMAAVTIEHADPSLLVAKDNQLFIHQRN